LQNMINLKYFENLRCQLLKQMEVKFTPLMNNPAYILACLCDQRQKLNIFKLQGQALSGSNVLGIPKYQAALDICTAALNSNKNSLPIPQTLQISPVVETEIHNLSIFEK
ncbi:unnamed protein product, partial [Allacma fusca]